MIDVEYQLRLKSKECPRVFFLVLFACGRDSFVARQIQGEQAKEVD